MSAPDPARADLSGIVMTAADFRRLAISLGADETLIADYVSQHREFPSSVYQSTAGRLMGALSVVAVALEAGDLDTARSAAGRGLLAAVAWHEAVGS